MLQYSTTKQNVMQGTESKTFTEIGAFLLFSILIEPGQQVRDLVETHADYRKLNGRKINKGILFLQII